MGEKIKRMLPFFLLLSFGSVTWFKILANNSPVLPGHWAGIILLGLNAFLYFLRFSIAVYLTGLILLAVILILQACLRKHGAAVSTCECSIILSPEFKGTLDVYDAPNGRVLRAVGHNEADEDFIFLDLRKSTDKYFEVSVHYSLEGHIVDGWVRKSDVLGIYSRAYNGTDTFELFDTSDTGSQKPIVVMEYSPALLPVIDCATDGWLKVRYSMNGTVYEGWLQKEAQCANPYTTCN